LTPISSFGAARRINKMTYLLASSIPPLLAVLFFKWRTRVELDAKREGGQIDAQNVPIQLLKEELARSRAELAEARALDREERKQHAEDMTAVRKAIEEIATDIRGQREEARQHAANVHKRIDILDDRLLVIETRLEGKKA
jgi:hypothetical protein